MAGAVSAVDLAGDIAKHARQQKMLSGYVRERKAEILDKMIKENIKEIEIEGKLGFVRLVDNKPKPPKQEEVCREALRQIFHADEDLQDKFLERMADLKQQLATKSPPTLKFELPKAPRKKSKRQSSMSMFASNSGGEGDGDVEMGKSNDLELAAAAAMAIERSRGDAGQVGFFRSVLPHHHQPQQGRDVPSITVVPIEPDATSIISWPDILRRLASHSAVSPAPVPASAVVPVVADLMPVSDNVTVVPSGTVQY